jgi:hypothetical protein
MNPVMAGKVCKTAPHVQQMSSVVVLRTSRSDGSKGLSSQALHALLEKMKLFFTFLLLIALAISLAKLAPCLTAGLAPLGAT